MRWIQSALLLGLLAHAAAAQPAKGDIIAVSHTGDFVLSLNRSTGVATTLATLPTSPLPVLMAANNRDILCGGVAQPGNIWSVSSAGAVTTIAQSAGGIQGDTVGMDWLQDGRLITAHSLFGVRAWLRKLDLQSNTPMTVFSARITHARHVAIDSDTGHALVPRWAAGGELLRIDLGTGTITTVVNGINDGSAVDTSPITGNYIVSEEAFSDAVKVVSPGGVVLTTINVVAGRSVKVDDTTGNIVVVTNTGRIGGSQILEIDEAGNTISTWGPFTPDGFSGVEIYGSRTVHGQGPATPGSSYAVSFSFPGFGGAQYVGALSLGQRPGIKLPGGAISLAFDGLFLASLLGQFVTDFQGTLDANGQATGSISISPLSPAGFRFYCSAVAISGGNVITGNTIGITVQ